MQGWAGYFRPAIAKNVFGMLDNFTWWRVIRMLRERHHWRWKYVGRRAIPASRPGPTQRGDPLRIKWISQTSSSGFRRSVSLVRWLPIVTESRAHLPACLQLNGKARRGHKPAGPQPHPRTRQPGPATRPPRPGAVRPSPGRGHGAQLRRGPSLCMRGRARSMSSGSPRRIWGFRRCLWRSQLAAPLVLLPLDHAGRRDRKHVSTGRRRWEGHRYPIGAGRAWIPG